MTAPSRSAPPDQGGAASQGKPKAKRTGKVPVLLVLLVVGGLGVAVSGARSSARTPTKPSATVATVAPAPPPPPAPTPPPPACPAEMVLVEGSYCTDVRQDCNRWATSQPTAMNDAGVFNRAVEACMDGRGYSMR